MLLLVFFLESVSKLVLVLMSQLLLEFGLSAGVCTWSQAVSSRRYESSGRPVQSPGDR